VTTKLSLLDLAPIAPGQTVRQSFEASVALAQAAETAGYERVWYAEHHNMATIASSATSVLIGHVAEHTATIRLGAGGVMLPNHSPLVIAEQFGTLASLYPDRIDLGLGRAGGSDAATLRALGTTSESASRFPQDVLELRGYLRGESLVPGVSAVPGAGTNVPLFILGSSLFGAQLAAHLGLPYAFASHFAPGSLLEAVATYRREFTPTGDLDTPYVMAGVNVIAAEDPAEARRLFEHRRREWVRDMLGRTPAQTFSDEEIDAFILTPRGQQVADMLRYTAVGAPAGVRAYLEDFAASVGADELITVHLAQDGAARLDSVALTAEAMRAERAGA
jgi:luciferase family oxidoreductase group 1